MNKLQTTLLPIIRVQLPKMIANQIANVQPIMGNTYPKYNWTQWRRTISIWPRRSINDKIIFGWINKRSREDMIPYDESQYDRTPRIREFATNKELFTAKLKGRA